MERSEAVKTALLRFYEGISKGRVEEFDDIVSSHDATSVQGTAPGEFVTERPQLRFGFETEGVTLTTAEIVAWEEGSVGWAFDTPTFGFPDGSSFPCRLTAILRNEGGTWRLLHGHFSVGVPDEEVVELAKRWS